MRVGGVEVVRGWGEKGGGLRGECKGGGMRRGEVRGEGGLGGSMH